MLTRVSPKGVAEGARKPQPLAPVKEETEEPDLGSTEGEDAPTESSSSNGGLLVGGGQETHLSKSRVVEEERHRLQKN